MANDFKCAVFLNHSARDNAVVRLSQLSILNPQPTGVWFFDWFIRPGNFIGWVIEGGLESSLVLAMSRHALGCTARR